MKPGEELSYRIYPLLYCAGLADTKGQTIGLLGHNPATGHLQLQLLEDWHEGLPEDDFEIVGATLQQFEHMAEHGEAEQVMKLLDECSNALRLGDALTVVEATADSVDSYLTDYAERSYSAMVSSSLLAH